MLQVVQEPVGSAARAPPAWAPQAHACAVGWVLLGHRRAQEAAAVPTSSFCPFLFIRGSSSWPCIGSRVGAGAKSLILSHTFPWHRAAPWGTGLAQDPQSLCPGSSIKLLSQHWWCLCQGRQTGVRGARTGLRWEGASGILLHPVPLTTRELPGPSCGCQASLWGADGAEGALTTLLTPSCAQGSGSLVHCRAPAMPPHPQAGSYTAGTTPAPPLCASLARLALPHLSQDSRAVDASQQGPFRCCPAQP